MSKIAWTATASFLLSSMLWPAGAAPLSAAGADRGGRVQVNSHGIRLSLSMENLNFPQYALVPVVMVVQNVSRRTVWVRDNGAVQSGTQFPQPEVQRKNGDVVYPPALRQFLPLPGPGPSLVPLKVGKKLKVRTYVILRGPRLRVLVRVATRGRASNPAESVSIVTPFIHMKLHRADTPSVVVVPASDGVYATLTPLVPWHARILYMDSANCGDGDWEQNLNWTGGTRSLFPGCPHPTEWHALAGWVGHSVASVEYLAR